MKIKKTDVAHWLDANPHFKSRSMLRLGAFEYTKSALGEVFTPDHVQMSNLVLRRMQELVPNNLKGVVLEAQYRDEEMGMASIVELATKALTPPGYVRLNGQLMKIK